MTERLRDDLDTVADEHGYSGRSQLKTTVATETNDTLIA